MGQMPLCQIKAIDFPGVNTTGRFATAEAVDFSGNSGGARRCAGFAQRAPRVLSQAPIDMRQGLPGQRLTRARISGKAFCR